MSIICQKSFTLEVNDVPVSLPLAYWKLDEGAGLTRADQLGNANLDDTATATASVPAVINNGARFNAGTHFLETSAPIPFQYVFTDGWTILGWWQHITGGGGVSRTIFNYSALPGFVAPIIEIVILEPNLIFSFQPTAASPFKTITITKPTDASFHFFRFWYDPADAKIKAQIDMGAISETGSVLAPTVKLSSYFAFGNNGASAWIVDEWGFFRLPLSDAVVSNIYNSGAGKTCCPFV